MHNASDLCSVSPFFQNSKRGAKLIGGFTREIIHDKVTNKFCFSSARLTGYGENSLYAL